MQKSPDLKLITKAKADIEKLLREAIDHAKAHEEACAGVEAGKERAIERAWQAGIRLNKLKPLIGHGHWLTWLDVNFCKPLGSEYRTAALYMKIDADNPNVQRVADLEFDTIRKYAIRFVPEKDRPQLKGNVKFPRLMHHLTVVNAFNKWKRRRETGQIEKNLKEERRDFKELFEWLRAELFSEG